MFYSFLFLLAQLEGAGGEAAKEAGKEAAAKPSAFSLFLPLMLGLLIMMLLMRPRKGNQKLAEQLAELKKNDRIVTAGGIIGTVMSIRDDSNYVTLRIDESTNTKMQILKTSIIRVLGDDKEEAK